MAKYIVKTEGIVASKRHRTLEIWTDSPDAAREKAIQTFVKANQGKTCTDVNVISVVKCDD